MGKSRLEKVRATLYFSPFFGRSPPPMNVMDRYESQEGTLSASSPRSNWKSIKFMKIKEIYRMQSLRAFALFGEHRIFESTNWITISSQYYLQSAYRSQGPSPKTNFRLFVPRIKTPLREDFQKIEKLSKLHCFELAKILITVFPLLQLSHRRVWWLQRLAAFLAYHFQILQLFPKKQPNKR